jgi:hypothetical protein
LIHYQTTATAIYRCGGDMKVLIASTKKQGKVPFLFSLQEKK